MERNITITLEKAREWYNGDNKSLKEIALQAFDEKELMFNFRDIKTFQDACEALRLTYGSMLSIINQLKPVSRASAAMFELNIIRKALNLGQDLHLTEDPEDSDIHYPHNQFVTEESTYYKDELNSGRMEVIGKIESEGKEYNVLSGYIDEGKSGLGCFSDLGVGHAYASCGFLGCASEEIAKHFGKYFGMLITEAKYGDMVDFEIIESKYK